MRSKQLGSRELCRAAAAMLCALAALLLVSIAEADAVPPPPADCPAGSRGETCHGGPHCRPKPCDVDADCSSGETCQDLDLCLGQVDCAGGWDPDAGPHWVDTVEGSCANGAACSRGTCQTTEVCAPPPPPAQSTVVEQGCGCRLPARGPSPHGPLALALALLGLWTLRRRHQAR